MLFKEKGQNKNNGLLSVNYRPTITKTETTAKPVLRTILRQKKKIIVYVDENKYYIDHAAAFALGLIKTRAIMLDKPKLVEINLEILQKLKNDESIEIEYKSIEKNKPKIKVYVDASKYCIDKSTAYSLRLIDEEEFFYCEEKYYYIDEQILNNLKNSYEVEMYSLKLKETTEERMKK